MHHNPNIAPQHMFDGVALADHGFNPSPSLPALHLSHPSPGSTSSLNDRHLEPPQTYEALLNANTTLKTRVSELEVINDLFKGRVAELEQNDAASRRSEMIIRESENRLRQTLDETQRREDSLKRRVAELERVLNNSAEMGVAGLQPQTKKIRLSDVVDDNDMSM